MTVDDIYAPANSGKQYSIGDVISAIQGQYKPVDVSGAYAALPKTNTGAAQYIPAGFNPVDKTPAFSFSAGNFDKEALAADYQKKIEARNIELANQLTSQGLMTAAQASAYTGAPQNQVKPSSLEQAGALAGSAYGYYLGGPVGAAIGGTVGSIAGKAVNSVSDSIADVFGW